MAILCPAWATRETGCSAQNDHTQQEMGLMQTMSLELLQSIEKAEAKAEGVRAEAQREAREILKTMEDMTLKNERDAVLEHRELTQYVLEEARVTATRRIEMMKDTQAAAREAVTNAARKRMDAAADLIYERVVQDGHR